MKSLFLCLCSVACSSPLRAPVVEGEPKRFALGVAEPREVLRIGEVELAIHDSAPQSNKPVLLCLHAIGHGGGDYVGVEADQGDHFRVISVDWPGHGYSGTDREPARAARYAALIAELIDRKQWRDIIIIGNSIGGAASVIYAANHSDRVRALVLANPGGFDPGGSSWLAKLYIGSLIRHFEQGVRGEQRFAGWFADYYEGILRADVAKAKREAIVAAGYESAPLLVQAWESFRSPAADLQPLLRRLKTPVLLAWAKDDAIVSWSRSKESASLIANAKVVFFEGAGHSAFLEAPAAFNAQLNAFVNGL